MGTFALKHSSAIVLCTAAEIRQKLLLRQRSFSDQIWNDSLLCLLKQLAALRSDLNEKTGGRRAAQALPNRGLTN
jgi:hypothetical protein